MYGIPRSTLQGRVRSKVVHGKNPSRKPYLVPAKEKELSQFLSQEGAANDRSPPKKKRRFGFGKSKDTKKKAKKTSQKKRNKKEKPFVMELGSPADSPASVRAGSSQASTSSPKQGHPTHPAPTFDISAVSFSSFSDDNDVIVKDVFRRKVS